MAASGYVMDLAGFSAEPLEVERKTRIAAASARQAC